MEFEEAAEKNDRDVFITMAHMVGIGRHKRAGDDKFDTLLPNDSHSSELDGSQTVPSVLVSRLGHDCHRFVGKKRETSLSVNAGEICQRKEMSIHSVPTTSTIEAKS